MKGTEKQIAWATDIKESAIRAAANIVQNAQKGCYAYRVPPISVEVAKELEQVVISGFSTMDDAAQIINVRERFTQDALERMAQRETNRRNA